MITLFVYILDGLVTGFFTYKLLRSLLKKYNPFMLYFVFVAGFSCLNFIAYAILITYSIKTNQPVFLFWADYFGRFFAYIASIFAIQILLYKLVPKRPERIWGSIIIGALSLYLAIYNLFHPNFPYIDKLQIIHWQSPLWLGLGLAVILLGIWLPTSVIFLLEYVKSKFKLTKSLYLGSGFLIGSIGASFQDFGTNVPSYILINFLFLIGFVLIFIGILLKGTE